MKSVFVSFFVINYYKRVIVVNQLSHSELFILTFLFFNTPPAPNKGDCSIGITKYIIVILYYMKVEINSVDQQRNESQPT